WPRCARLRCRPAAACVRRARTLPATARPMRASAPAAAAARRRWRHRPAWPRAGSRRAVAGSAAGGFGSWSLRGHGLAGMKRARMAPGPMLHQDAAWVERAAPGSRSVLQADVEVVLPSVAVERGRDAGALVVLDVGVVEVQRIQGEAQVVVEPVAQRRRQGAEVVLVVRVGAGQADQEGRAVGVADARAEHLVLEPGADVVGVLRGAHQVIAAVGPGVAGAAIGPGVVGADAEVGADRLLVGH